MKLNVLNNLCISFLAATTSVVALAEDVEGLVKAAGSAATARTFLTPDGSETGTQLCSGDIAKGLRRLGGMTVKVSGDWKMDKKGEKSCFEPTEFAILKVTSGREAIVGMLSQKDGAYVVTGPDGKVHALGDVPGGLKKLDGQKVILDIKPLNSPTAKEAAFKVVTYAAHP